jgi:hypothetical protein
MMPKAERAAEGVTAAAGESNGVNVIRWGPLLTVSQ